MKSKTLLKRLTLFALLIFTYSAIAQTTEEDFFNSALKSYVNKLLIRFGKSNIDRERFLIQQLRSINEEMKSRIGNVPEQKQNYFNRVGNLLSEVQDLKGRLSGRGSHSLKVFVEELEATIQSIIDTRTINYKKQKTIEDAVQLLHIAEEMVQLDPNSDIESDPDFSKSFSQTQTKINYSFGEGTATTPAKPHPTGKQSTVFDVYKEWKKTELVKYQVRWSDVQIIKSRLYKDGTATQQDQMFKRELRQAAEAFNYGMYSLSEKLFGEILRTYKQIGNLDDCLFFKGQSNFLLKRYRQAELDFSEFTREYPSSSYLPEAYHNLMNIAYHFENYDQVLAYYDNMRIILSANDSRMHKMTLMAAATALKNMRYSRAIELAFEIPATSELYTEARFVLAEGYAGIENYEESKNSFNSLIQEKDVAPQFRFTVLLKLGFLSYEMGEYFNALNYFDQIAGTYGEYDRVLIGYAWTHYKKEQVKELSSEQDFSVARKYLEVFIDNFYVSDYLLEAQTLLGYILQLQDNPDGAISNFETVFDTKQVKFLSDSLNEEYELMSGTMKEALQLQEKALQQNDPQNFQKAYTTVKKLRRPITRLGYMDLSASGVAVKSEVSKLNKQLAELDRLKKKAESVQNKKLVNRIERMQLKIYRAVNSVSISRSSNLGQNFFDANPLARKESVSDHNNQKIEKLRSETQEQREELVSRIVRLDYDIQNARSRKDYRKQIKLELSRERLSDLAQKLDALDTRAFAMEKTQTGINLNHWSNYGAFGMTNVRFDMRLKKAAEVTAFQKQMEQINEFLEIRKKNLERKIGQIADEITLMTRRVRRQERIREREELKRQFEETYFDTHDTELNYNEDTTQPPKLRDSEE